jgi:phage-related protein
MLLWVFFLVYSAIYLPWLDIIKIIYDIIKLILDIVKVVFDYAVTSI